MNFSVIEPYRAYIYLSYLKSFNEKTSSLLEKYGMSHVDFSRISESVSESLDQIFLPDFVISFDEWLVRQESCEYDRYIRYFKDEKNMWKNSILPGNTYITTLAEHIVHSTVENLRECLDRFTRDYSLIKQWLNWGDDICLKSIEILGGDRHENGQQPVKITTLSSSVIYKPRSTGIESVLNSICSILGFYAICPQTVERNNYLWQRFVSNDGLDVESDAQAVYENYGFILGIADYLNINDCHFDNFIVDRNKVYLIDAETSFQYFYDTGHDFERSVLQTGLLQSQDTLINGAGHTSAITAVTNIFQSYTYPHALHDASEKIQVSYERGFARKTQNYPHVNGVPVKATGFIPDVVAGYEKSFNALSANKKAVLDVLEKAGDIKPRFLIRTTAYYLLVINQLINPKNSRNFIQRFPEVFNEYLRYEGAHESFDQLIPYESSCLQAYDVPIFYIDLHGRGLTNGDGGFAENFLPHSPFTQIRDNFERGGRYLERQKEIINWSMNVNYIWQS